MDLIFVAIQNTPGIFKLADAQIAISPTPGPTFTVTLQQNNCYVRVCQCITVIFILSREKYYFSSAKK